MNTEAPRDLATIAYRRPSVVRKRWLVLATIAVVMGVGGAVGDIHTIHLSTYYISSSYPVRTRISGFTIISHAYGSAAGHIVMTAAGFSFLLRSRWTWKLVVTYVAIAVIVSGTSVLASLAELALIQDFKLASFSWFEGFSQRGSRLLFLSVLLVLLITHPTREMFQPNDVR